MYYYKEKQQFEIHGENVDTVRKELSMYLIWRFSYCEIWQKIIFMVKKTSSCFTEFVTTK